MRLSQSEVKDQLDALQQRVEPAERFVALVARDLSPPIFCDFNGAHSGYRYARPDRKHFCLLKYVRAVSAVNAAILLARRGFTAEIGVLVRTITECLSQIEFVLSDLESDGQMSAQASKLVSDYFDDFARGKPDDHKKSTVNQSTVHRRLGAQINKQISETPDAARFAEVDTAILYKNVSQVFSAFVHCKYPESMDMYGGHDPHFHLRGMAGTPKDAENLMVLSTFVDDVTLCVRSMVLRLGLFDLIQKDAVFFSWYRSESATRWKSAPNG